MASFRIPRWVRRTLIWLGSLVAFIALLASGVWLYLHPTVERIDGIVYGQRGARPLTLDILRPTHPNGLGIALMVSGKNREKPGHPRHSPAYPSYQVAYRHVFPGEPRPRRIFRPDLPIYSHRFGRRLAAKPTAKPEKCMC